MKKIEHSSINTLIQSRSKILFIAVAMAMGIGVGAFAWLNKGSGSETSAPSSIQAMPTERRIEPGNEVSVGSVNETPTVIETTHNLDAKPASKFRDVLIGLQQRRSGAPSLQNADVAILRKLLQSSPVDAAQLRQMLIEGTLSNADAFILARVLIEAGDRESLNSVMQSLRAAAMAGKLELADGLVDQVRNMNDPQTVMPLLETLARAGEIPSPVFQQTLNNTFDKMLVQVPNRKMVASEAVQFIQQLSPGQQQSFAAHIATHPEALAEYTLWQSTMGQHAAARKSAQQLSRLPTSRAVTALVGLSETTALSTEDLSQLMVGHVRSANQDSETIDRLRDVYTDANYSHSQRYIALQGLSASPGEESKTILAKESQSRR